MTNTLASGAVMVDYCTIIDQATCTGRRALQTNSPQAGNQSTVLFHHCGSVSFAGADVPK